jgi:hypothetical protein
VSRRTFLGNTPGEYLALLVVLAVLVWAIKTVDHAYQATGPQPLPSYMSHGAKVTLLPEGTTCTAPDGRTG